MNIKHEPIFNTDAMAEHYSKKDGVAVKYVCTSALGGEAQAMDIFYRDTPHPQFGNRYFGMFIDTEDRVMITNADRIEGAEFAMIEDSEGNLHYSAHRHDCKMIGDNMIDGGRAYIRSSGDVVLYKIRDGEIVKMEDRTSSKLPTIIAVNDRLNEVMVEELDGSYNRYKKVLTMWSHFCIIEKCEMEVESGSPCNWCGLTENQQYD